MVIAKTASRNVAFKTNVMSQAVLEAQASFVTPEATDQEGSSERYSLDGCLMTAMLSVTLIYTFLIMKLLMVNCSLD